MKRPVEYGEQVGERVPAIRLVSRERFGIERSGSRPDRLSRRLIESERRRKIFRREQ